MVYGGTSWPGVEKSHHVKWLAAVLHVQSPNEQWHEVGVPFSFGQRIFCTYVEPSRTEVLSMTLCICLWKMPGRVCNILLQITLVTAAR